MKIKAKDIIEADTLYELSTGLKPVKHNYIVCEIIFNIEEKDIT
jgi:hypothetical protein